MQETGSKEDGSKGSTHIVCPGTLTALTGKDIVNYPEGSDTPRDLPAIYYEAENGDIILTAPRGKIKIAAEAIEIIARVLMVGLVSININADDKILLDAQTIDLQSKVSTKIFSEKTVEVIGKGIMNVYGGLVDFADRTTKGKPSKFPSVLMRKETQMKFGNITYRKKLFVGLGKPKALGKGKSEIRGSAYVEGPLQVGRDTDYNSCRSTVMIGEGAEC